MLLVDWLKDDIAINNWCVNYGAKYPNFEQWLDEVSYNDQEVKQLIIDKKLFNGAINLSMFVEEPYTDKSAFNIPMLRHTLEVGKMVVDKYDSALQLYFTGLADMFIKMGITYGDDRSLNLCKAIAKAIKLECDYKYLTIADCPVTSTILSCSYSLGPLEKVHDDFNMNLPVIRPLVGSVYFNEIELPDYVVVEKDMDRAGWRKVIKVFLDCIVTPPDNTEMEARELQMADKDTIVNKLIQIRQEIDQLLSVLGYKK